MEHSTSAPNERVLRITQLAKLSFNHPWVVLTADDFQYLYKNCTSAPVAGTLVVGTMNNMAVVVPHTMLSSLLPVGVSHRRPLHPQSFVAPQAGRRVVVEFEHTLAATRSQPPVVRRVMAYDSSSSAVT